MNKLQWNRLLCDLRRKDNESATRKTQSNTTEYRTEIERDFDRILFVGPTRRLADKTQVFPMDGSDSVRTRLTHSLEVSNLARSIGTAIVYRHYEEVFANSTMDKEKVVRGVPALLGAIGLAHDLGNPPFGHQGEVAIQNWFQDRLNRKEISESSLLKNNHLFSKCTNQKRFFLQHNKNILTRSEKSDLLKFDGNPQTLRLLGSLQILSDDYGLNLTYATLSALIKYPKTYDSTMLNNTNSETSTFKSKKRGAFHSERKLAKEIREKTGLSDEDKHPLTFIMEACDDIAYSVIDAEDTIKKGLASFQDLIDHLRCHLKGITDDNQISKITSVINSSKTKNDEFKNENLSSYELNDLSMQMFRVYAIGELVKCATETFVHRIDEIMTSGSQPSSLIELSNGRELCSALKKFDRRYGFSSKQVLELESKGYNYITATMDMLWIAISQFDKEANVKSIYARFVKSLISENYIRAYTKSSGSLQYRRLKLLADYISGMTDNHLVKVHDKLKQHQLNRTN